ncbi:MAG: DUF2683 family protein [Tunicatimonas sp.]
MKSENTFIVRPDTAEQEDALIAFVKALKMKFEITEEQSYDADFVAKVQESRKQYQEGNYTRVEKDELQKFLGLE